MIEGGKECKKDAIQVTKLQKKKTQKNNMRDSESLLWEWEIVGLLVCWMKLRGN